MPTRFDLSDDIFFTIPLPAVMITSEGSASHPKIIVLDTLKASPSPGPPSSVPPVWHNASHVCTISTIILLLSLPSLNTVAGHFDSAYPTWGLVCFL